MYNLNSLKNMAFKIAEEGGLLNFEAKCLILTGKLMQLPSGEYLAARGREVIVHCEVNGGFGQAFTDSPREFKGSVREVLEFELDSDWKRAVFFATLNAILHKLRLVDRTIHCVRDEPEKCGELMLQHLTSKFGRVKVAHIGYQPGHVKVLAEALGPENLYVTDLDYENIGKVKFGVKILDGELNDQILRKVKVAYITGSAAVNNTLPQLLNLCRKYSVKPIIYGVTGRGISKLLNLEDFCPYGHNSLEEALH